ncbi:hypothetical protein WN48_08147 [Eufriesea mexicana]|uniref:Uncharacterized protein n=1 Tax=Eufriesea mexicana TaxID=516756 RepID=A0A310SGP8_9HYME|nr:hypothetical protein WN48_08147 [Eufriesea mexicana]
MRAGRNEMTIINERRTHGFLLDINANRKSPLPPAAKHFQPFTFYHAIPPEFHRPPYCLNSEEDPSKIVLFVYFNPDHVEHEKNALPVRKNGPLRNVFRYFAMSYV